MPRKQKLTAAERKHQEAVTQKRRSTETHLGMPWAEWQTKKRQEWHAVMKALDIFRFGAAYTPVCGDLYEVQKVATRIEESLDRDWVSW